MPSERDSITSPTLKTMTFALKQKRPGVDVIYCDTTEADR